MELTLEEEKWILDKGIGISQSYAFEASEKVGNEMK